MHRNLPLQAALTVLGLGVTAAGAVADQLSGFVVDAQGLPVAGVNISAKSESGGGNGNLANGGTDASGFFDVTIDPGVYEFTFEPPPPPAAVALAAVLEGVVVSGNSSLGTVALGEAVAVSGRTVSAGGIPVAGVNLDVIDLTTGENIVLPGDITDLSGQFSVATPPGPIEVLFDTTPILAPLLAPHQINMAPAVSTNVGDVQLAPGFKVTAAVFDPSFQPLVNVDVDVRDPFTGVKLYTPGDNTDNNGFVDFVVPQGVYDIEICPQFVLGLVPHLFGSTPINATTNLGIVTLAAGVPLTGTVTSHLGPVVGGADVDVVDSATQLPVFICDDNTNGVGQYQVIVPNGQYDLVFTPPYSAHLASSVEAGVVVNGATSRNAVLPFCDCGTPSGPGVAGSAGLVPQITAIGGSLRLGNPGWGFDVTSGLGGGSGFVMIHFGPQVGITHGQFGNISLMAGRALVVPLQLGGIPGLPGAGSASFPFPLPGSFPSYGTVLSARAILVDPAAPSGKSHTPVLSGAFCQ